jgi:hypothetical protein
LLGRWLQPGWVSGGRAHGLTGVSLLLEHCGGSMGAFGKCVGYKTRP